MRQLLIAPLLVVLAGCSNLTVYVSDGAAVQLRQPVKAKVWVHDASGERVAGQMVIPEGWYAMPDDGAE
jgi:hypothetical protein